MEIRKEKNGSTLTLSLEGRLDTATAPDFQDAVEKNCTDEITRLIVDLKDLDYTSSAGLRVFLKAQKLMASKGGMTVRNVCDTVSEIFDITGFSDILNIE